MKSLLLLLLLGISLISYNQYCTNVGPSSTIDSNVEQVTLTGALGTINFTGCPGVMGLQDLTNTPGVSLNAGSSYTISIKWGTCGGVYAGAGTAWIDFNLNGTFEASEVIATWQGTPPFLGNYPFVVPAGAQNGTTRMRISQQEATSLPLNPCASFTWGSTTDFTVTIGNGIDCSGYTGNTTADPIIIPSLPYADTGDNSYCYSSENAVYGSPDIYYQLNPNPLMGIVNVSLCGSSFDTFLSVIDTDGNVIAFNDDGANCGTSSKLTFDSQGLGAVYIIVEGWGFEAGPYTIEIDAEYLAINEELAANVSIYPNPAKDQLFLNGINGNVYIYDIAGKMALTATAFDHTEINLSSLEDGLYVLKWQEQNVSHSTKIIIER